VVYYEYLNATTGMQKYPGQGARHTIMPMRKWHFARLNALYLNKYEVRKQRENLTRHAIYV